MTIFLGIVISMTTFTLTGFFRRYAIKKSILDLPNERSLHATPTPRGGGIIFVFVFYVFLFCLFFLHCITRDLFLSLLGALPIAIIGYCDDLYSLSMHWRLLVHCLSATWGIAWLSFSSVADMFFPIFLTLWFVNLYNFMDGIDGLAASEAVFVAIAAGIVLLPINTPVSMICFGLGFSVLGFLFWNWQPAKIFMGDIGSGFLGYCFAILMWSTTSAHRLPISFWFILLGVFLVDATYTLLRRMIQRKKWYSAHREHIYQKMVQAGLQHYQMNLIVILINLVILLPLAVYSLK